MTIEPLHHIVRSHYGIQTGGESSVQLGEQVVTGRYITAVDVYPLFPSGEKTGRITEWEKTDCLSCFRYNSFILFYFILAWNFRDISYFHIFLRLGEIYLYFLSVSWKRSWVTWNLWLFTNEHCNKPVTLIFKIIFICIFLSLVCKLCRESKF